MRNIQIAVDGPSGAGKSSLAKKIAAVLGILYLDTGAMYRAVALKVIRTNTDFRDEAAVVGILESTNIDVVYNNGEQCVVLDGEDVSDAIRENTVSMGASAVSAYLPVRRRMVLLQQTIAASKSVIMDGRDIGTHVLPNADLKIYLTASPEVRAARRHKELLEKGILSRTFEELLVEIKQRDWNDSYREHAPLIHAKDAELLDTSELNFDEAEKALLEIIKSKLKC